MEETFSVENPIRENIDYAFKNLIFYVTASTQLDIYIEQKENFKKVLDEINTILAIYVNKESLVSINEEKLQNIKFDLIDLDKLDNNKILISAKRDIGIDRLIESICEKVFENYIRFKLKIPYSEGKMISNIMENATILDSEYIEDGVIFNIECSEKEYVKYKQYIIQH